MKHIFLGILLGLITILSISCILTIHTRSIREEELDQALQSAMWEVMDNLSENQKYSLIEGASYNGDSLLLADFCQHIIEEIELGNEEDYDEDLDLTISVTGVDTTRGLLSLRVTETFSYPILGHGKVSCDKTLLLDSDYYNKSFRVTYLDADGATIYKEYQIFALENFVRPSHNPWGDSSGYWADTDGNKMGTDSNPWPDIIDQDYTFVAVYEKESE